ncbi:hypothetical protein [Cyanobium gracile]|uniref:DUF3828 domain-containing protein n=1 Tax=Cyanobium gracile (strain ATCC 27147 / PCC 6307) TaxID=292564 RepID=K9P4A6_CYAGP|nr:hypothetical protein [Cyanobium gracile]AFY27369.1 hypothetical protein Cyagr_0161 [Cyanobium gracile PCC 6307]
MPGQLRHLLAAGLAGYCVLLPQAGKSQEVARKAQEEVAIGPSDTIALYRNYRGTFMNTTYNIGGDVTLRFESDANGQVTGYINFSNKPGAQPICGAGSFQGIRNGRSLSLRFLSSDPDPGCSGYDQAWAFFISAVLSADGTRLENGSYQVNNSQAGVFQAAHLSNTTVSQAQNTKANTQRTPEELIKAVYKLNSQKRFWLPDQKKSFLIEYFDEDLANLFIRANECRKRAAACTLDFDPIVGSNAGNPERGFSDFEFQRLRPSPEVVVIQVSYTWYALSRKRRGKMIYHLRKTPQGWRISDIVNPDGYSIKSHLSQPFSR